MKSSISRAITYISSLPKQLQVRRFGVVVLVGFLLLTINVAFGHNSVALGATVSERVQQNTADRPKTTGEWLEEARETEGSPGKRAQRIGKESAEAFKEFGSGYVEGAKETARDIRKNVAGAGK